MKKLVLFLFVLLGPSAGVVRSEAERLILDTDAAIFNDDGAALVMLLQQPEKVELLGITVVSGNHLARQGAEHLLHILEVMGVRDVPLYIGAQEPLANSPARARLYQQQWGEVRFLGGFAQSGELEPPHGGQFAQQRPQPESAISFMIRTLEAYPGEVTILAIGPLTNLAMLLQLRPDLAVNIKRLVFMGGNARVPGNVTPYAEFNFWYDPEAARYVLRSPISRKIMFGLDVTNQAAITLHHFEQVAGKRTPLTEIFAWDMGSRWPGFYQNPEATGYIWDCLAVAFLLDPSLFPRFEELPVDVSIEFGPAYGGTFVPAGESPARPLRVALDLDFARFFQLYKDLLTRWPPTPR